MTPSPEPRNHCRRNSRAFVAVVLLSAGLGCIDAGTRAPRAEFLVSAGDSTYWVRSDRSGIKMRGSPMVLARLDDRFLELYVVDEDHSFENALFVGQRLYQRDLISGDSTEIFRDTVVPAFAEAYERSNPDARRVRPDEDIAEEPEISATVEVSVLSVHGPFLSMEHHVDTSGAGDGGGWHMTRHTVVDLRTGQQATVAHVLGPGEASSVLTRARKLYQETIDSVRRDERPAARRAARSLARFRFDPTSFSLTAPNGTLMIAFSAPGQGVGGEGFVLPIRPIPVTEPAWWLDVRGALPTNTREREELWSRGSYFVKALYDTAGPVQLSLVDSAGVEFRIGRLNPPVHRIYWIDQPPLNRAQRTALSRAFDAADLYDDEVRADLDRRAPESFQLASRR